MPDLNHELLDLASDGSTVAARCIASGTLYGSLGSLTAQGRRLSGDLALFAYVRDGKIDELWEIVDTASLLSQLGSTAGAAATPSSG